MDLRYKATVKIDWRFGRSEEILIPNEEEFECQASSLFYVRLSCIWSNWFSSAETGMLWA